MDPGCGQTKIGKNGFVKGLARPKIIIDVSNLSYHRTRFIRTGIQEVIYRVLLEMPKLRGEFSDVEWILLPQLPRKVEGRTLLPYFNTSTEILAEVEDTLRMPSREIWGFDLREEGFQLSDSAVFSVLSSAAHIHIQSLVDIGPLGRQLPHTSIGATVYDLIPVLFPEYCDDGIARWYQSNYLPSLGERASQLVCISQQTARDVNANAYTRDVEDVQVLSLASQLSGARRNLPEVRGILGLRRGDT